MKISLPGLQDGSAPAARGTEVAGARKDSDAAGRTAGRTRFTAPREPQSERRVRPERLPQAGPSPRPVPAASALGGDRPSAPHRAGDPPLAFSWDLETFPLRSRSSAVKACQMDLSSSSLSPTMAGPLPARARRRCCAPACAGPGGAARPRWRRPGSRVPPRWLRSAAGAARAPQRRPGLRLTASLSGVPRFLCCPRSAFYSY